MDGALRMRNLSSENQPSLFDEIPAQPVLLQAGLFGDEPSRARVSSSEEIALDVRLQWERELLGMYFSGHPLSKYKELLREKTTPIPDLEFVHDGRDAVIGGRVSSLKKVVTRSGEEMAFVNIEDDYDTIEVIVFPRTWQKYRSLLVKEKVVLVRGSLEEQEEARRILAREVLEADLLVVSGHNP
jgi:DNA polymerase-3 subunit alpha